MPAFDIAHDINGDYYVVGQTGEQEDDLVHRHVLVYKSDVPGTGVGVRLHRRDPAVQAKIARTVQLNYWHQATLPFAVRPTNTECLRIAYIHGWSLALGLLDTKNDPKSHNLVYNDVKIVEDIDAHGNEVAVRLEGPNLDGSVGAVDPTVTVPPGWNDDSRWRRKFRHKITNVVSLLAFFVRTRGHHYKPEFAQRYTDIWRMCMYDEDDPGLAWELVCHNGLHAVYPDVLDDFWKESVDGEICAGALIKRWHSYAAGQAAFGVVKAGATDLVTVFPRVRDLIPEAFDELDRCDEAISAPNGRWVGSVNRRFYRAHGFTINERKLAPLAAVVLGALELGSVTSRLRDSPALRRVAEYAPITGASISNILAKAAQHDRMVYAVLPGEESGVD